MTDGTITFDTAIDNKGLLKDIEKQKKIIENSTKKIQSLELKKGSLSAEAERLGEALEQSGNQLEAIQAKINSKKEIGLKATKDETAAYNAALRENDRIVEALNKQDAKISDINSRIAAEQGNIDAATQRAAELNAKVKGQSEAWDKAKGVASNFMKRLGTMIKKVFVFSVILAGLRKVKEYFSDVLKNNTQFQSALAQMKGAWRTAFQPVVEWIMPILMKLMNFLTQIGYTIAAVFARFTGKTVGGLKASAKAATNTTKAVKGLNKQMKQLAGFDEMNVLSDSSSGGSDAEAAAAPAATYDFDTSGIESNIDKIIAIASAALLAIGLILVFTGANIPLGVGMIIVGAAGLAAEAAINWDTISEALQGPIGVITAIVSAALLVIGAILAFSGANIALGIGMMIVGAAGLAAVVMVNWDTISEALQGPIGTITAIVGAALLVLGAIFAFTGANIPLGIGMMLVGAAGLAATVAVNWDTINKKLQGPLGGVVAIVGAALLALGAVLTFTGAALPLGIGLLIAGAAAAGLAAKAGVNWETIKQKLQGPVGKVVAIVSAALLALGAILCFTGAGIPLGIGLIAVGAAGLAATASVNWDTVKQKVRTVVSSLLAIASGALLAMGVVLCLSGAGLPLGLGLIAAGLAGTVLANKLDENPITKAVKGMVNGLISIIEGFINKIISGINWLVDQINKIGFNVPDWVPGIGGKRFGFNISHVSTVTLPRLAEGAVIPANREFLAVLGDQKTGTNIETPLATMVEAFRTALETYGGGDVTIPIYLDGKQIARHVININQQRQFASNY